MNSVSPGGRTRAFDQILDRPAISVSEVLPYVDGPKVWRTSKALSEPISVVGVRELTPLEAEAVRVISRTGTAPLPEMKAIRARHHELARLLAAGNKEKEAAEILGMHVQTVQILKRSPAFTALLSHYMAIRDSEALGIRERIEQTALDVLLHVSERLQTAGDEIPLEELRKLGESLLDRSGYSPVQKSIQLHGGLSAEEIASIRKQHAPGQAGAFVPSPPKPEPPPRIGPPHGGIDFAGAILAADSGDEGGGTGV